MRFLTITCNPALDTTYLLGRLRPAAINRVDQVLPGPGGKGNNVARVLALLGYAPVATGFVGGATGRRIEDGLAAAGVRPDFVRVAGESRVCLTLVEAGGDRITEVREPGAPVAADDARRLLDHVAGLANEADAAVIAGSLPPGLPPDFYPCLIGLLQRAGVFVALDASGDALRRGAAARPDLVKPNREELAELIGPIGPGADLIEAAHRQLIGPVLCQSATVLLSLGAEGAVLIRGGRGVRATAPAITAVNPVGAGDALLAGYLDARARNLDDEAALAHAVAVGTAAARQTAVGRVAADEIAGLRQHIQTSTCAPREAGRGSPPDELAAMTAGGSQGRDEESPR